MFYAIATLRIGVRSGYPLFAEDNGAERKGYEIAVARMLAARLGVTLDFVDVTPVTRLSSLRENRTDLVLATMGHNSLRDGEARFIRPHYYRSETMILGTVPLLVQNWTDLADRTVCVTVGNYSNALLAPRVARLMLFDRPSRLIEALKSGTCRFIAQDDSVLASLLNSEDFAARFEPKLSFAAIPWGMAVAREGSNRLAELLDALSREMHADGQFLMLAEQAGIATLYLDEQASLWRTQACQIAPERCVAPALETRLAPSLVAGLAEQIEGAARALGMPISLNMVHSEVAWHMFLEGLVVSLLAIGGGLAATFGIALGFGSLMAHAGTAQGLFLRTVVVLLQGAPNLLILATLAAVANALFTFSLGLALVTAILSIGLMNGAFAGQAIAEAYRTLEPSPGPGSMRRAVALAAAQIEAFLVNATRGIAAASFVGVTDLTNALTDISSFSSNQSSTYWILLIFYVLAVFAVVWGARRFRKSLEASEVAQ